MLLNLFTLSSILGQYLGPEPSIEPEYTGDKLILSDIILCVCMLVLVIPHSICLTFISLFRKENGTGIGSADCISTFFQSILDFSNLGGVPVFSLPIGKPNCRIFLERISEDLSPILPADIFSSPI